MFEKEEVLNHFEMFYIVCISYKGHHSFLIVDFNNKDDERFRMQGFINILDGPFYDIKKARMRRLEIMKAIGKMKNA